MESSLYIVPTTCPEDKLSLLDISPSLRHAFFIVAHYQLIETIAKNGVSEIINETRIQFGGDEENNGKRDLRKREASSTIVAVHVTLTSRR